MVTKTYTKEDALQKALELLELSSNTPEWGDATARRAEGFIKLATAMDKLGVSNLSGKHDRRAR